MRFQWWVGPGFAAALLLFAAPAHEVSCQKAQVISIEGFREFRLNDTIALNRLAIVEGDWAQLHDMLGAPVAESCEVTPVAEECTFSWAGAKAEYTTIAGRWDLYEFSITGPEAFLAYGARRIHVGDSIDLIKDLFPAAYQSRGCYVEYDGERNCSAAINAGGGSGSVTFIYDPQTDAILGIIFHQLLT